MMTSCNFYHARHTIDVSLYEPNVITTAFNTLSLLKFCLTSAIPLSPQTPSNMIFRVSFLAVLLLFFIAAAVPPQNAEVEELSGPLTIDIRQLSTVVRMSSRDSKRSRSPSPSPSSSVTPSPSVSEMPSETPMMITESPMMITESPMMITESPMMITESPMIITESPTITDPDIVTEPPTVTDPVIITEPPTITDMPTISESPMVDDPPVTDTPLPTPSPLIESPSPTVEEMTEEPMIESPSPDIIEHSPLPVTDEPTETEMPTDTATPEPTITARPSPSASPKPRRKQECPKCTQGRRDDHGKYDRNCKIRNANIKQGTAERCCDRRYPCDSTECRGSKACENPDMCYCRRRVCRRVFIFYSNTRQLSGDCANQLFRM